MELNQPKTINAWCSYDWANSVYNLIVTTAIFPVYYTAATKEAFGSEIISFFRWQIDNTVIYTYAISASFLITVCLYPILSGIADYSGMKKRFMQFFTYLGSCACLGLYFFHGRNVEFGILLAMTASIGYAGSVVFYNAFLPEIASEDKMDNISARGFSMGYVGSVVLLIVCLVLILNYESFGFESTSSATRFAFLLVGTWWIGFSQIAFSRLKDSPTNHKITSAILSHGFNELKKVFQSLNQNANSIRFLYSFFFYSMGVQTVMLLAPLFGETEIGMTGDEMIMVVLILQVLAIAGAYSFAFISNKKGNKFAIILAIIVWLMVCVGAYFAQDKISFYTLAAFLGFVMGGIQSISRSTYSKLIPSGTKDSASYFSFYDVTDKLAIVLGTASFGAIEHITGSMRNSILMMTVFFIVGLVILQATKLKHKEDDLQTS
ncbi:MAG: MFS transporter [Cyclobacteriaceae bacterium]